MKCFFFNKGANFRCVFKCIPQQMYSSSIRIDNSWTILFWMRCIFLSSLYLLFPPLVSALPTPPKRNQWVIQNVLASKYLPDSVDTDDCCLCWVKYGRRTWSFESLMQNTRHELMELDVWTEEVNNHITYKLQKKWGSHQVHKKKKHVLFHFIHTKCMEMGCV